MKSNKDISDFLEHNKGKEFVGFVNATKLIKPRLSYYHLFTGRNIWGKINSHILIPLQKLFCIHYKHDTSNYRLGPNWCTISYQLVEALLKEKKEILKRYRYGLCCDEIFLQTFIFEHKQFLNNIFDLSNQYRSCMRHIDWQRGNPYTFTIDDLDEVSKAEGLFVRKVTKEAMIGLANTREHKSL